MSDTGLTSADTHNEYPHIPGYLYDCQACESACHCTPDSAECVYDGPHTPVLPAPAHVPGPETAPAAPATPGPALPTQNPAPEALPLAERVGVTLVHAYHTRRFPAVTQCVFAGSSHRTTDELACDIVRMAIAWGATDQVLPNIDETMAEVLAYKTEWWDGGVGPGVLWLTDTVLGLDLQDGLYDLLDQALDYLQTVAPDGYEFELDDGLYLCPAEDEDAR